MEIFTLIVWLMMGQRYEEARILNLGAEQCLEQLFKIRADRGLTGFMIPDGEYKRIADNGQCIGTKGLVLPRRTLNKPPVCATGSNEWCGGPLPGRRRI